MIPFKTYCFMTQLFGAKKSEISPDNRIWVIIPEESDIYKQLNMNSSDEFYEAGAIMTHQRTYADGSEWLFIMCSHIDIAVMITNEILGLDNSNGKVICLGTVDTNDKDGINKLRKYLEKMIDMFNSDDSEEEEDTDERGSY